MLLFVAKLLMASLVYILLFAPAALSQSHSDSAVRRGIDAISARRYDTAIVEFTNLISANPKNGEYHALRGTAYYRSGSYLNSEADFALSISLGYDKQIVYEQLNNAVSRSEMASISFAGQEPVSIMNFGFAELKAGNYKKALAAWTILLSKNLEKKFVYAAYTGRAETFIRMGRKGNAKIDAQSLINAGCTAPGAYDLLKRTTESSDSALPKPVSSIKPYQQNEQSRIPIGSSPFNKEATINRALGDFMQKQLK